MLKIHVHLCPNMDYQLDRCLQHRGASLRMHVDDMDTLTVKFKIQLNEVVYQN